MMFDQDIWRVWARILHRWGVNDWVASFLEAAGPLSIVGAQLVYLSQPIVGRFIADGRLNVLARMLEEPDQARAFVTLLREVDR